MAECIRYPRNLVLSRKGFDTTSRSNSVRRPFGGVPSPVFPDGSIYSLPIPGWDDNVPITYGDLYHGDEHGPISIGQVVEDLTQDRPTQWTCEDGAFLSPDIREPFWAQVNDRRGMFAAGGAQLSHLRNQGIAVGDLFLFFGLFQKIERVQRSWRFVRSAPRQHILFGWLQVGLVHPDMEERPENNVWYVASDRLDVGNEFIAPGVGVFPLFHERLALSKPGGKASEWRLPRWFYPDPPKSPLTYHPRRLWTQDCEYAYVQRRGPGQEFVLNL